MKEVKNIIFDFGGVLIDWNPKYVYKDIFKEESELEFFLNHVCNLEWNEKQDAGRLFKDGIAELVIKYPQYKREIELFYTNWIDMVGGEIEENIVLINELNPKYQLFGLTNWSAETLPLVYDKYSFFKKLNGIIVSGEEKVTKPGKEIYNRLLSQYQIEPEYSLFIDDNEKNISTAKDMGFHTIHYRQGMSLREEMKKKDIDFNGADT